MFAPKFDLPSVLVICPSEHLSLVLLGLYAVPFALTLMILDQPDMLMSATSPKRIAELIWESRATRVRSKSSEASLETFLPPEYKIVNQTASRSIIGSESLQSRSFPSVKKGPSKSEQGRSAQKRRLQPIESCKWPYVVLVITLMPWITVILSAALWPRPPYAFKDIIAGHLTNLEKCGNYRDASTSDLSSNPFPGYDLVCSKG